MTQERSTTTAPGVLTWNWHVHDLRRPRTASLGIETVDQDGNTVRVDVELSEWAIVSLLASTATNTDVTVNM